MASIQIHGHQEQQEFTSAGKHSTVKAERPIFVALRVQCETIEHATSLVEKIRDVLDPCLRPPSVSLNKADDAVEPPDALVIRRIHTNTAMVSSLIDLCSDFLNRIGV